MIIISCVLFPSYYFLCIISCILFHVYVFILISCRFHFASSVSPCQVSAQPHWRSSITHGEPGNFRRSQLAESSLSPTKVLGLRQSANPPIRGAAQKLDSGLIFASRCGGHDVVS